MRLLQQKLQKLNCHLVHKHKAEVPDIDDIVNLFYILVKLKLPFLIKKLNYQLHLLVI